MKLNKVSLTTPFLFILSTTAGASVHQQQCPYHYQLMRAVQSGDAKTVRTLLDADAQVNSQDYWSFSPLMYAVYSRNSETVRVLLKFGAEVNYQTDDGDTSLIIASRAGNTETVRALLKADADENHQNNNGDTPLKQAIRSNNVAVVTTLLKAGVVPTDTEYEQLSSEQKAIIAQRYETTRAWLLSLEDNHDLPRDLSRLVGTFAGLPNTQNLSQAWCNQPKPISFLSKWMQALQSIFSRA